MPIRALAEILDEYIGPEIRGRGGFMAGENEPRRRQLPELASLREIIGRAAHAIPEPALLARLHDLADDLTAREIADAAETEGPETPEGQGGDGGA